MAKLTAKDKAIIEMFRKEGNSSLAVYFANNRDKLRRMMALRLDPRLEGRVDGSDIVQEAYMDAHRKLEHYLSNPTVPPKVWLRKICQHILHQVERRHISSQIRDVRREDSQINIRRSFMDGSSCVGIEDLSASVSNIIAKREANKQVVDLLDRLSPQDREVLVLRHMEELNTLECAAELGITVEAAKKRYQRALRRLKQKAIGIVTD